MNTISEQELIRQYNKAYGKAVGAERKKRKLSLEKLASGLMSGTMLDKVERGAAELSWAALLAGTCKGNDIAPGGSPGNPDGFCREETGGTRQPGYFHGRFGCQRAGSPGAAAQEQLPLLCIAAVGLSV